MRLTICSLACAWLLCVHVSSGASDPYTVGVETKVLKPIGSPSSFGLDIAQDGDAFLAANTEGAVGYYERNHGGANAWQRMAEVVPPNGSSVSSMDIDGDHAAISYITLGSNGGQVHLHERHKGGFNQWGQIAIIEDSSGSNTAVFGWSTALQGDRLVVGMKANNVYTNGAAIIFGRHSGGPDNWGIHKVIPYPAHTNVNANFSSALDLEDEVLAVGSIGESNSVGAVYLFGRNVGGADNWGQIKRIGSPVAVSNGFFGLRLDLFGDRLLVGTSDEHAYLYERNTGGANNWGLVKTFTNAGIGVNSFGSRVKLWNDRALMSAVSETNTGPSGAAYLYARNRGGGDAWGLVRSFVPSDAAPGDFFGIAITHDGRRSALTSMLSDEPDTDDGAVYVYDDDCINFTQTVRKDPDIPTNGGRFGAAADIWGDVCVIGEPGASSSNGVVHVKYRNAGSTDQWFTIYSKSPVSVPGWTIKSFGRAVALWNDSFVAGANMVHAGLTNAGSVFLFRRNAASADTWEQTVMLVPLDPASNMNFGTAVDIEVDTIVVGAPNAMISTSVNAGATYVFQQINDGGFITYDQVAKLSSGGPGDFFGTEVDISGDIIAVRATGVDTVAINAGAVLIYHRHKGGPDAWGLVKVLASPDPQMNGAFGQRISLHKDRLVAWQNSDGGSARSMYLFERHLGGPDNWGVRKTWDFESGFTLGSTYLEDDLLAVVSGLGLDNALRIYHRNEGGADHWGQADAILAGSASLDGSLSMFGRRILFGRPFFDNNKGEMYIFEPTCTKVTTTNDVVNGGDGLTSLREAITAANASGTKDEIVLDPGRYRITIVGSNENANATGDFDILAAGRELRIRGAGAKHTEINGNNLDRVFHVHSNALAKFSDLTIAHGRSPNSGTGEGDHGGGIMNYGTSVLYRVMVISNLAASGVNSGSGGLGGGIFSSGGNLVIEDSTIAYNDAGNGADTSTEPIAGSGGHGGGIFNIDGDMSIRNSTISRNETGGGGKHAGAGSGGHGGSGGGIFNTGGEAVIEHTTIAFNSALSGGGGIPNGTDGIGGGIFTTNGSLQVGHTILANNNAPGGSPGAAGMIFGLGYNLIQSIQGMAYLGDTSGTITNPASLLMGLVDNSGPTWTHMPGASSPALNSGNPAFEYEGIRDQRGVLREPNAVLDIGAVEATLDFDSDGIPDDWENINGLDFQNSGDAVIDQDFDSFNSSDEYISNTFPLTPSLYFRVLEIASGTAVVVEVQSSLGRQYSLWRSPSLPNPLWTQVLTNVPGDGLVMNLIDSAPGTNQNSYRVTVRLP